MSARAEAIVTAGLRPELFAESGARSTSRTLVIATLVALVLGGLLPVYGLLAVWIALCLGIAALSFRYLETPLLRRRYV